MLHKKSVIIRRGAYPLMLIVVLTAIAGLLLAPTQGSHVAAAEPVVLLENGFEDGTAQGWSPRGAAVVAASTEAANTGSYSLKVTGRTAGWNGPSLNVTGMLQKNAVYQVSAYVRLVSGQSASRLIVSMQRTPVEGETAYEWIAPSAEGGVTDAQWVHLQGQYTFITDVTDLVLYVESTNETVEFYVDDVTITMLSSPPPTGTIRDNGFEDGTTQGWSPRGSVALEASTEVAHTGDYSLKTTGRTEGWNGPSLNVIGLLQKEVTYTFSLYVRLVAGQPASRVILSMQRTPVGETTAYDWIAPSAEAGVTDTQWVQLQGQYSFATDVSDLVLYVESTNPTAEFYIDDVTIMAPDFPPIQTDIPSVYQTLADYFPVGAAVEPAQIDEDRHAELLKMHFNSITAENAMKPESIQPAEGTFTWDNADRLVQFARDNNILVHGHTLVWHSQVGEWMFADASGNPLEATPENKALVLERLETHIRAVVGRYKDDVNVWDVVNEVIDPGQPDCMRRSRWYELTGTDYIVTAFNVANEVAPDAVLIINDYSTTDPVKRTCLYNVVTNLRAQGVPVEGVGHQMHVNIENPSAQAIEETIELFAGLGIEQHITELDMSIYTNDVDQYTIVPEEVLVRQGYQYRDIFDVFKRHGEDIASVTFWGLADDHTWLRSFPITRINLPLLFDEQLQAKHAYWGIVDPSKLPVLIQQQTTPQGKPIVDGRQDLVWMLRPGLLLEDNGLSASVQTRWDQDRLYVFVDVDDSTRDREDRVEVFIDQNNAKTTTYESDDRHYTFKLGVKQPEEVRAALRPEKDGYRLEASFQMQEALAVGQQIGFDIRITDASQADDPLVWNDWTNSQATDTSKFGTLTLVDAIQWSHVTRGTPIIDASQDRVWRLAREVTTDTWVIGTAGATAEVKLLWDDTHLYLYATVTDSLLSKASTNAWEEDSVEIFVDQNNAKTTSYQADDGQYRVNFDNEQSLGGAASADNFLTATRITDTGYVVEAAITLSAITPVNGTLIGFDFQVNDDGLGDGVRSSVVTWDDPTGQSYQNTSRLGVLRLIKFPWW